MYIAGSQVELEMNNKKPNLHRKDLSEKCDKV